MILPIAMPAMTPLPRKLSAIYLSPIHGSFKSFNNYSDIFNARLSKRLRGTYEHLPGAFFLLLAELRFNKFLERCDGIRLIGTVRFDRDLRSLGKTEAHEHEDALGVSRLALRLDLHLGFELCSRLHENGSRTRMDSRLVLDRQCCFCHLNLSLPKDKAEPHPRSSVISKKVMLRESYFYRYSIRHTSAIPLL